ncbi:hypothetical protein RD110_15275 [Rhodoferax koreense]|uniref:Surface-adhesin protein E-like domain-containing protein n=1 Tax=Rhodoferax koreensis TaxID=1842727 RepID=A0A1P8JXB0_9BURK|nr:surface-adhesin E family protein [Rhodoferax koreense]APW38386.1 hypothetical protein RD110_15275 [Rhodoferax koreense]
MFNPRHIRFAVGVLLAGQGTAFADSWFSITGDPLDPAVETVQVAPDTVVVFGDMRVMKIRTNRAAVRKGFDGLPFRSYESSVQIDCTTREANFRRLELFDDALWRGAGRVLDFANAAMPRMLFQDMRPNPVERIVQAACDVGKVQNR